MKHKLSAAALTAVILAGMLSGCANSPKQDSVTTAPVSSEALLTEDITSETVSNTEAAPISEFKTELPVALSLDSGFYDGALSLEIASSNPEAVIHYTTDGSVPNTDSPVYSKAVNLVNKTTCENLLSAQRGTSAGGDYIPRKNVMKANVIRAAAFFPDGTQSEIVSGTYFVGIDRENNFGDLPVVSLFTDTANLFDKEKGIYVLGKTYEDWVIAQGDRRYESWEAVGNYSNSGKEWERPVTVQWIEPDGTGFTQDMGFRIMGAASRSATQKSFKFIAREEYGNKSVKYELIPDNIRSDKTGEIEKYKSFALRNGGNDCDYSKLRDPLFQELVADRRFDTQQYAPCVVFLDGEYWGMYTLVEDYSDNYIENNYGIDNKNVVIVKRGEVEDGEDTDIELWNEMFDYITQNDMTVPENYAKACEMLDMGGFIDMCALNLYINNEDSIFHDNNWRMWRVRSADNSSEVCDGKWRMLIYDIDFSGGIYDGGRSCKDDNISESFEPVDYKEIEKKLEEEDKDSSVIRHPRELVLSLYKNTDFKNELVTALCDMRNYNFESSSSIGRLVELSEIYSKVVPATFDRFGPEWLARGNTADYYNQKINELAVFLDGRYEKMPEIMQSSMELGDICKGKISVSDKGKGNITVNLSELDYSDTTDHKAVYFSGMTVTLNAAPAEHSSFAGWEIKGCTTSEENGTAVTVVIDGDFSIKAIYE